MDGGETFCFFQTAETANRTPNSSVKSSGANHYPRAPVLIVMHATRQKNKLHTHKCGTSVAQMAIRFCSVTLWIEFSSKVCFDFSLTCYKRALKTFFYQSTIFCYKSYPLMYYIIFCLYHATLHKLFFTIQKCNFLRGHTPVGVLSYLTMRCYIFLKLFYRHNVVLFFYCISNNNKYF